MVPVGEGRGLIMLLKSFSGMVIFRGEICGYKGLTGDMGASSFSATLWYNAVNWIFITVLGKRNVHLVGQNKGKKNFKIIQKEHLYIDLIYSKQPGCKNTWGTKTPCYWLICKKIYKKLTGAKKFSTLFLWINIKIRKINIYESRICRRSLRHGVLSVMIKYANWRWRTYWPDMYIIL